MLVRSFLLTCTINAPLVGDDLAKAVEHASVPLSACERSAGLKLSMARVSLSSS